MVHRGLFAGEYHVHSHLRYLPPICLVSSKHITPELPKPSPISLQPSSHNRGVHTPITSPHKPSSSCIFQPLLCFQKKKNTKTAEKHPHQTSSNHMFLAKQLIHDGGDRRRPKKKSEMILIRSHPTSPIILQVFFQFSSQHLLGEIRHVHGELRDPRRLLCVLRLEVALAAVAAQPSQAAAQQRQRPIQVQRSARVQAGAHGRRKEDRPEQ